VQPCNVPATARTTVESGRATGIDELVSGIVRATGIGHSSTGGWVGLTGTATRAGWADGL